jgi:uncharacterized membrane protein YqjE
MTVSDFTETLRGAARIGARSQTVFRGIENRAALASLELEEGCGAMLSVLGWVVFAASAALLVGVTVNFMVAAAFWDTPHRFTALAVLGVCELLAGLVAGAFARMRWRAWFPLEHTRDQLKKDSQCLRQILN